MKIDILDLFIAETNPARVLILDTQVPLETFVCPVCEKSDRSVGYSAVRGGDPKRFLERKLCRRCRHVFTSFGPSKTWHENYYSKEWYKGKTHGRNRFPGFRRILKDIIEGPEPDLNLFVARPFLKRGMKILEVGSGGGRSLLPFKKAGMECFAVEPSANSAQSCREKGITVFQMTAEEALSSGTDIPEMDVVLSNHSLEHFADPNQFFTTMEHFLKPDGLVIINVPNKDFTDIFSETMFVLHPQSFSEHSLALLLRKYGFCPVSKIVNDNLVFLARRSRKAEQIEADSPVPEESGKFYSELWGRRYQLDRHKNQRLIVEWDGQYLLSGSSARLSPGEAFPPKRGQRSFLIEMHDVETDYAVLFESRIEKNAAFGVIK